MKLVPFIPIIVVVLSSLIGCSEQNANGGFTVSNSIDSITWLDGDPGILQITGEEISFRLVDVDAPQTGKVGSEGGPDCEKEQEIGQKSRAIMALLANPEVSDVVISGSFGFDSEDRTLLSLVVGPTKLNVADMGVQLGILLVWPVEIDNSKPNWCE